MGSANTEIEQPASQQGQALQRTACGCKSLSTATKTLLLVFAVISIACAVAIPIVLGGESSDTRENSSDALPKSLGSGPATPADQNDQNSGTDGEDTSQGENISLLLEPSSGCNRYVHLCAKKFNEVTFATTHNAYATLQDGFPEFLANQNQTLASGLVAGVRALMLDVHLIDENTIKLCHFACALGSLETLDVLNTIAEFLELNPREIVTIIWETQVKTEQAGIEVLKRLLTQTAEASRLAPFLRVTLGPDEGWPTLEEMIASGQRLVWLNDRQEGTIAAWDLHLWDYVVDTPYANRDRDELNASCRFFRGDADNQLFLINHFLSDPIPSPALAATVNFNPFLVERVRSCALLLDRRPNFIAVDYLSSSDLLSVVADLNSVATDSTRRVSSSRLPPALLPGPRAPPRPP